MVQSASLNVTIRRQYPDTASCTYGLPARIGTTRSRGQFPHLANLTSHTDQLLRCPPGIPGVPSKRCNHGRIPRVRNVRPCPIEHEVLVRVSEYWWDGEGGSVWPNRGVFRTLGAWRSEAYHPAPHPRWLRGVGCIVRRVIEILQATVVRVVQNGGQKLE